MIQVYPDFESLSRAAAALVVEQAKLAAHRQGRFSLALSGADTPRRTYELLAQPPLARQAPWEHFHVFWGDERCVPQDDPRSNAGMARETWLNYVPIPAGQIHPIACATAPAPAARQYEAQLRDFFAGQPPRLDLVLMGLGENGHTASLFPGSPALEERQAWAVAVYLAEEDLFRVTLTAPLINQAVLVVFLVRGKSKAGVLREVLHGPPDPRRLPAQLIQPQSGNLLWLIDQDAASQLIDSPGDPTVNRILV